MCSFNVRLPSCPLLDGTEHHVAALLVVPVALDQQVAVQLVHGLQKGWFLPLVELAADQAILLGALQAISCTRPKALQLLASQHPQRLLVLAVHVDVHILGEALRELRPQADDIELSDDDIHSRSSLMIRSHKEDCKKCDTKIAPAGITPAGELWLCYIFIVSKCKMY